MAIQRCHPRLLELVIVEIPEIVVVIAGTSGSIKIEIVTLIIVVESIIQSRWVHTRHRFTLMVHSRNILRMEMALLQFGIVKIKHHMCKAQLKVVHRNPTMR
jgi:hypothetical protein